MARRTGIEPASPEGETPSALPAKLTARVEGSDEFLVSTTATTLARPAPTPADAIDGQALHPACFLKSQSKQSAAVL